MSNLGENQSRWLTVLIDENEAPRGAMMVTYDTNLMNNFYISGSCDNIHQHCKWKPTPR